jgi:Fungal specific transcription factor domain
MHPSLVNAVSLVACHFASAIGDTRYEEYERYFLKKTREELETSLTVADRLTDFVYATTLLVWYYFVRGQIAEAQFHVFGLACFLGACRMNAIDPNAYDFTLILPPTTDDVELEERVTLFWSVFILDRYSSLLCNTPSTICDEVSTYHGNIRHARSADISRPFGLHGLDQQINGISCVTDIYCCWLC